MDDVTKVPKIASLNPEIKITKEKENYSQKLSN
jgi:hypothetical protein